LRAIFANRLKKPIFAALFFKRIRTIVAPATEYYAFQFHIVRYFFAGRFCALLVCGAKEPEAPELTAARGELLFLCVLGLPVFIFADFLNAARLLYRDPNARSPE